LLLEDKINREERGTVVVIVTISPSSLIVNLYFLEKERSAPRNAKIDSLGERRRKKNPRSKKAGVADADTSTARWGSRIGLVPVERSKYAK
jgi:hypothetical protein